MSGKKGKKKTAIGREKSEKSKESEVILMQAPFSASIRVGGVDRRRESISMVRSRALKDPPTGTKA